MAAFGDDQVGRVLGGRYRLIAPVGTGASATVFVADDVQLQRRVAVKILHPSLADDAAFLKRFRAEAQAVAALAHPNVMAVYDWGQDGEESNATPYLVLEYLSGGSLRSMLDRGRHLTPSQALLVGLEAARGLDYAHRRGFVHRDIKPANLLFGEDRRLRIADFGLARAIAEAAWTEPDGVVLGTARYASPEQARGMSVDGKTDVYSLALTLIESVTGQVPFAADTTVATLMNRLDKLMPVSAELGPLASVLERAGRPEPADRYDAGELARALVQAAERLPRPSPLPLVATLAAPGAKSGGNPDDTTLVAVPGGANRAAANGSGAAGGAAATLAAPTAASASTAHTAEMPRPAVPVIVGGVVVGEPPPSRSSGPPPSTPTLYNEERERPHRKIGWFVVVLGVLVVAALAATGILIFQRSRTESHDVSSLVGLPRAEALNRIAEFDWKTDIQRLRSDAQPYDYVFDQTPKDGKLKEGGILTLMVSDGPMLHALPDISQQDQAAAQATLAGHGSHHERGRPAVRRDAPGQRHPVVVGGRHAQPGRPAGADGHQCRRRALAGPLPPHHRRPREPPLRRGQRRPHRPAAAGAAAGAGLQRHRGRRQRGLPEPAGRLRGRAGLGRAGRGVDGTRDDPVAGPQGSDGGSGQGHRGVPRPGPRRRQRARSMRRSWPRAHRPVRRSSGAPPSSSSWADSGAAH